MIKSYKFDRNDNEPEEFCPHTSKLRFEIEGSSLTIDIIEKLLREAVAQAE